MKSQTPLLAASTLGTTCQGQSNRRAGREWWASGKKPPGYLAQTAQQDGYAGRLLFTIAGEAKWMSAGFHLTGNLRNVKEVRVNELFWVCLVMSVFFPPLTLNMTFTFEKFSEMFAKSIFLVVTAAYFNTVSGSLGSNCLLLKVILSVKLWHTNNDWFIAEPRGKESASIEMHHPWVTKSPLLKMWHWSLFLYRCCIHSSALGRLLQPRIPLPPCHPLIPLHTSINRRLQSAQSHIVLNAAVVQLQ